MTIRGSHLLWGVLAVAVVVWALTRLGASDERRIRRQLGELESLIEKAEVESNLIAAGKVRRLGDLMTPEFEIVIAPYSQVVRDRRDLARVAMAYRSRSPTIGVAFRDQDLAVDRRTRTAELAAVAVLSGDGTRRESYRVAILWSEHEGEWLIRRVDVLEVLDGALLF